MSETIMLAPGELAKECAKFAKYNPRKSAWQLTSTMFLYVLGWVATYWSVTNNSLATPFLWVLVAGLTVRLFCLKHECLHGSLLKFGRVNDIVTQVIGVITLTPPHYWRRAHNDHHKNSGNLDERKYGEIDTLTVDEYHLLSPMRQLRYRLYRSWGVMLTIGPVYEFMWRQRVPAMEEHWCRERNNVHVTTAYIIAVAGGLCVFLGWERFLMVQLPVSVLAGAMGIFLFYVQHNFPGTYWQRLANKWDRHKAALLGSSFFDLPRVLHWFSANIGYHHIHHLCPLVPNYMLKECHRALFETDARVTRLTLWQGVRNCWRLKLWDEEGNRLVTFAEARALQAA